VLHDIGKIVFSAVHPELLDRIKHFSSERDIAPGLFEDLSAGYNHAEIGAKIAEKWNFSDSLIEAIRFHHEPNACRPEHRLIVYCVYLGNAVCGYESGEINFDIMDHSILGKFRITTEDQFKEVQHRLSNDYEAEIKIN
jgi:HD-like signal output (HDOD) protein